MRGETSSAQASTDRRNPLGRSVLWQWRPVAHRALVGGWSKKYWHRLPLIVVGVMEWMDRVG